MWWRVSSRTKQISVSEGHGGRGRSDTTEPYGAGKEDGRGTHTARERDTRIQASVRGVNWWVRAKGSVRKPANKPSKPSKPAKQARTHRQERSHNPPCVQAAKAPGGRKEGRHHKQHSQDGSDRDTKHKYTQTHSAPT